MFNPEIKIQVRVLHVVDEQKIPTNINFVRETFLMVKDLMAGLANNKIEIMKTNLHTNGQMIIK